MVLAGRFYEPSKLVTRDQENIMAIKITSKIVDYEVAKADAPVQAPQELQAAITPRTRGLVLCTPSNPSGRMLTRVVSTSSSKGMGDGRPRSIVIRIFPSLKPGS